MSQKQEEVGGARLLEGEQLCMVLNGRLGLLEEVPSQGSFLALTNQRLIGFWQEEGKQRQVMLPLEKVEAVEMASVVKSSTPLIQGALLILGAVAVVWLTAAFDLQGVLSWLIAGVMLLLGGVTAAGYFASEEAPVITFKGQASEVALPLHTSRAVEDAYSLATGFFQVRAGHLPATPSASRAGIPEVAVLAPSGEALDLEQNTEPYDPGAIAPSGESPQGQGRGDV